MNPQRPAPRSRPAPPSGLKSLARGAVIAWAIVGMPLSPSAATPPRAAPDVPNPVESGRAIANRLRQATPEQSREFTGTMEIVRSNKTVTLNIASRVSPGSNGWQITYTARQNGLHVETLTIVQTTNGPVIHARTGPATTNSPAEPAPPIPESDWYLPFAGSHFWRIDLALGFFFWPDQRHTMNDTRRTVRCRVLDSLNPAPGPGRYTAVRSWLRTDDDALIRAEAYTGKPDERQPLGRLTKQFLPGQVTKVNGVWQIESMTMRLEDAGEETTIRFDLER